MFQILVSIGAHVHARLRGTDDGRDARPKRCVNMRHSNTVRFGLVIMIRTLLPLHAPTCIRGECASLRKPPAHRCAVALSDSVQRSLLLGTLNALRASRRVFVSEVKLLLQALVLHLVHLTDKDAGLHSILNCHQHKGANAEGDNLVGGKAHRHG